MRHHSSTTGTSRLARLLPVAAIAALALTACAPGAMPDAAPSAPSAPSDSAPAAPGLEGELTISAAASLTAAFDEIAAAFAAANPGVDVKPISYDGSSTLATQIIEGAPVDVFASANESNMTKVVDAGLVGGGSLFATNTLVIAMPAGNPSGIETLADLADPARQVVLCAVEVPCGDASAKLLDLAGLSVTAVSYEQNVTAVLTKVAANEADAGLVYGTDVAGRDDVESIVPAGADEIVNRYPLAALDGAPNAAAAAAFVEFVLGDEGQAILAKHGFGRP